MFNIYGVTNNRDLSLIQKCYIWRTVLPPTPISPNMIYVWLCEYIDTNGLMSSDGVSRSIEEKNYS